MAAREDVERPSQAGRLRASPGWFAKFNNSLSPLQKSELVSRLFGGLLNLSDTLPGDFSKFLVQSYQPETSEMVFPPGEVSVSMLTVFKGYLIFLTGV